MGRVPSAEVPAKPTRRQFSVEFKARIVEEADACTQAGEIAALLRREGLYSSQLNNWHRQCSTVAVRQRVWSSVAARRAKTPSLWRKRRWRAWSTACGKQRKSSRCKKTFGGARDSPARKQRSMSAVTELATTVDALAACGALTVTRASYYRRRKPHLAAPRQVPVRIPQHIWPLHRVHVGCGLHQRQHGRGVREHGQVPGARRGVQEEPEERPDHARGDHVLGPILWGSGSLKPNRSRSKNTDAKRKDGSDCLQYVLLLDPYMGKVKLRLVVYCIYL